MGDTSTTSPACRGSAPRRRPVSCRSSAPSTASWPTMDEIKGKRRENLEAAKDILAAFSSARHAQARRRLPFLPRGRQGQGNQPAQGDLRLFQQLGFRRYQHEVRNLARDGRRGRGRLAPAGAGGRRRCGRWRRQRGNSSGVSTAGGVRDGGCVGDSDRPGRRRREYRTGGAAGAAAPGAARCSRSAANTRSSPPWSS